MQTQNTIALRGKKREFGMGVRLTIVTLGIYPLFWHYTAFKELYDQEQREFPVGLYVCSFIPLLNFAAPPMFMSKNLDFINSLRVRNGMAPIFGIGGFLGWYVIGSIIVIGPFVAYSRMQNAINELWDRYASAGSLSAASSSA